MRLADRIAFTLGALLIYRLGVHIPLPGVDPAAWARIFHAPASGVLQQFDFFSGGAVRALGIFSLGIVPYITAALIIQLMTFVSPALKQLNKGGEDGREILSRYTLFGTLFLAAIQAYGIAIGLEGLENVVAPSGFLFEISTVITLAGGTMLLVWLSQQITARGLGNGIALLLVAGIAAELPRNVLGIVQLGRLGVLSSNEMAALVLIVVALTGFVVVMERARRRLVIEFPARRVGFAARSSHLGLKLNGAGIVPIVLGSWLLLIVLTVTTLAGTDGGWLAALTAHLVRGPVRLIVSAVLVVLITFLYTAFVVDPEDMAEKLKMHGGVVAGVAPGEATAAYLDGVLSRTTTVGAAYLVLVALLPDILPAITAMPIYFGGASLLIMVCATLDIEAQVRAEWQLAPE